MYEIIHCFIISKVLFLFVCVFFRLFFFFSFASAGFWKVLQVQWLSPSRHVAVYKRSVSSTSSPQAWQQRRRQLPTQPSQRPWRSRRSSWRRWAATTAMPTTMGPTERMETSAPASVRMPFTHTHTPSQTQTNAQTTLCACGDTCTHVQIYTPFWHALRSLAKTANNRCDIVIIRGECSDTCTLILHVDPHLHQNTHIDLK